MANDRLQQFVAAFQLEQHGYSPPTLFEGDEFGFSTLKEPDFKLKGGSNLDDSRLVTLIHVAIENEDLESAKHRKPVYCRMQFVRDTQGRLSVDESLLKQIRNRPTDLISTDEYYYDESSRSFFRGRTPIAAHQLLDELYDLHKNAARNLRGVKLRFKILFHKLSANTVELSASLLAYIHRLIYGEKVEYNPVLLAFRNRVDTKSQTGESKTEGKKLPLFGYDANAHLIIAYCVIHLVIYAIFFWAGWFPLILRRMLNNNFLTVMYVVSSLAFLEFGFKRMLHRAVVALGSWAFRLSVRNITI